MQTDHTKPHLDFGSATGKTYLSLRLSRRFILNGLAVAAIAGVIAASTLWLTAKVWGTPAGAIGSVYALPAGPWGPLTAQPILIEAPPSLLSPNFRLGDNRWYFNAANGAEVDSLLRSAGLTPAQISALLPTLRPVPDRPGLLTAQPSPALVRALSPEASTTLYERLAQTPENFAQVEPFRITEIFLDDWLDAQKLPSDVIAQVKSLLWRRGS